MSAVRLLLILFLSMTVDVQFPIESEFADGLREVDEAVRRPRRQRRLVALIRELPLHSIRRESPLVRVPSRIVKPVRSTLEKTFRGLRKIPLLIPESGLASDDYSSFLSKA